MQRRVHTIEPENALTRLPSTLFAAFMLALLGGCATSWTVDSDVSTFSRLAAPVSPATYRFERLPSQQADPAGQAALEALAGAAMARVGLQRDDAAPRYSAQIDASVSLQFSPWVDPWLYSGGWGPRYGPYGRAGFGYGYGYGYGWPGAGWFGPPFPPAANPWYVRSVSVVLRELPGGQVVYETRAQNDGPYNRNEPILGALFEAAMQGFPSPPPGARRVDVLIDTAAQAAPTTAPR